MGAVTVRYFAMLREQRGCVDEVVQVAEGTTVEQLYHDLFPAGPLGRLPVAYAVDQAYVGARHLLDGASEVAFIPPVGGG